MSERDDLDLPIDDLSGGSNFLVSSVLNLRREKEELKSEVQKLKRKVNDLERSGDRVLQKET